MVGGGWLGRAIQDTCAYHPRLDAQKNYCRLWANCWLARITSADVKVMLGAATGRRAGGCLSQSAVAEVSAGLGNRALARSRSVRLLSWSESGRLALVLGAAMPLYGTTAHPESDKATFSAVLAPSSMVQAIKLECITSAICGLGTDRAFEEDDAWLGS